MFVKPINVQSLCIIQNQKAQDACLENQKWVNGTLKHNNANVGISKQKHARNADIFRETSD